MSQSPYQQHRDYFSRDHRGETLDQLAEDYLRLTRALHYKHQRLEEDLRHVLHFLRSRGVTRPEQLTPEVVLHYQDSLLAAVSSRTYNCRIAAAKQLWDHLLRLDLIDANPFRGLPRLKNPPRVPYLFPLEELARIFECKLGHDLHRVHLDTFHPRRDFARFGHYCGYHTLYACGLRISELTNLDLADVDLDERTFTIRESKFGKHRIIPFNHRVRRNLEVYLQLRADRFPHPHDPALFLSLKGKRHLPPNLRRSFRRVLDKLQLYRRSRLVDGLLYMSPRVHSLRHSFAVHRLLRWYREGADVNEKLPLLSTYMGHGKVHHTVVYLKVCAATLRAANARFAADFEKKVALWKTETFLGDFHDEL